MSKRKKSRARPARPDKPARPRWVFTPDVPTGDWFSGRSLDEPWGLQEAVSGFIYWLEEDRFLSWEAVVCQEQGLPLTALQEEAAGGLINFNDDDLEDDDRILYINDGARPAETWDAILNKIAPHLLVEPFRTADIHVEAIAGGFPKLMEALRKHGKGLSLPPGVDSYEEVVPAELRHKLWLQACFDDLSGLGQEPEINLKEQPERIEWFINHLRERKQSVAFLGLTLESLLNRVILPEVDRPVFEEMMQKRLSLGSVGEPIADHL